MVLAGHTRWYGLSLLLLGAVAAAVFAGPMVAHADTGTVVYGAVRGPAGALAGVSIVPASDGSDAYSTTTDADGNFQIFINVIPPGVYSCRVTLSKSGFATRTANLPYAGGRRYLMMAPPNSVYGELWLGTGTTDYSGVLASCDGHTCVTDSAGRFALTGLTPGDKTVVFSKSRLGTVSKSAELTENAAAYLNPYLTWGATLGGVITDSWGSPLSGAVVSAGATSTITDSSGSYCFVDIECMGTTVTVSAPGCVTRTQAKYLGARSTTTLDLRLLPPDSIGGAVRDSKGVALSGVLVTGGGAEAVSNANGRYLLEGVLSGAVTLDFSRNGYQGSSATTTLAAGSFTEMDGQLSMLGSVHGSVRGPAGLVIVEARVSACGKTVFTDSDGDFDLGSLPPGPTAVSVEATGFNPFTDTVTVDLGIARQMSVYLERSPGTVEGVVSAWHGSAVSNVGVQLNGEACTLTDRHGHYRVSGVPSGSQQFTFTKSGYAPKSASVDVEGSGSVTESSVTLVTLAATTRLSIHSNGVRTTYARACELTGYLKNGRGKGLGGRTVLLQESSGDGWKTVKRLKTGSTGRVHASRHPKTETDYRFKFAGDTKHVSGSSSLQTVDSCYYEVSGYSDEYNMWVNDSAYLTKGKHRVTVYASQGAKDAAIANTSLSWTKVFAKPVPASKKRTAYVKVPRTGDYYFGWHGSRYTNNYFKFTVW